MIFKEKPAFVVLNGITGGGGGRGKKKVYPNEFSILKLMEKKT